MPKFAVVERADMWYCEPCEMFYDDEEAEADGPLYECQHCGNTFNMGEAGSHQCPQCNKFASKLSDVACPQGHTEEMESVEVLKDTEHGGAVFVPLEKVQEDA